MTVELKPLTEMDRVVFALKHHTTTPLLKLCRALLGELRIADEGFDVHPDITPEDLIALAPLMHAVEEPCAVPLTQEELWHLHGAMDAFEQCTREAITDGITDAILEKLSVAVGQLGRPAG